MRGRRRGGGYGRLVLLCNGKRAQDQEGSRKEQRRSAGNAMPLHIWEVVGLNPPVHPHPTCCRSFSEIARPKAN